MAIFAILLGFMDARADCKERGKVERTIFITVDGMGWHLFNRKIKVKKNIAGKTKEVEEFVAPNLQKLARGELPYTEKCPNKHIYHIATCEPTETLPCNAAIYSGRTPQEAGITDNNYRTCDKGVRLGTIKVPTFMDLIPGDRSVHVFFEKPKLERLIRPEFQEIKGCKPYSEDAAENFKEKKKRLHPTAEIQVDQVNKSIDEGADAIILNFKENDVKGHEGRYGSQAQLEAMMAIDAKIGQIFDHLGEDIKCTAIIFTGDHGGEKEEKNDATKLCFRERQFVGKKEVRKRIKKVTATYGQIQRLKKGKKVKFFFRVDEEGDKEDKVQAIEFSREDFIIGAEEIEGTDNLRVCLKRSSDYAEEDQDPFLEITKERLEKIKGGMTIDWGVGPISASDLILEHQWYGHTRRKAQRTANNYTRAAWEILNTPEKERQKTKTQYKKEYWEVPLIIGGMCFRYDVEDPKTVLDIAPTILTNFFGLSPDHVRSNLQMTGKAMFKEKSFVSVPSVDTTSPFKQ